MTAISMSRSVKQSRKYSSTKSATYTQERYEQ